MLLYVVSSIFVSRSYHHRANNAKISNFIIVISLEFQILVGTGSRTMKIVKIKSLKVYAYGFCKY